MDELVQYVNHGNQFGALYPGFIVCVTKDVLCVVCCLVLNEAHCVPIERCEGIVDILLAGGVGGDLMGKWDNDIRDDCNLRVCVCCGVVLDQGRLNFG